MVHSKKEEAYTKIIEAVTPVLVWRKWTVYQAGRKKGKQDERKVQANAILFWHYRADLLTVLAKCMSLAMQICNDNRRAELGWKLPYPLVQDQLRPFLENIGQQNACLICKTTILENVTMSFSISTCKLSQSTPLLVPPVSFTFSVLFWFYWRSINRTAFMNWTKECKPFIYFAPWL